MLIIVAKDLILSLVQLIPLTVKGLGAGVGRAEKEFGLNVSVGSDIKEREKKTIFWKNIQQIRIFGLQTRLICPVKADHFEAIFFSRVTKVSRMCGTIVGSTTLTSKSIVIRVNRRPRIITRVLLKNEKECFIRDNTQLRVLLMTSKPLT